MMGKIVCIGNFRHWGRCLDSLGESKDACDYNRALQECRNLAHYVMFAVATRVTISYIMQTYASFHRKSSVPDLVLELYLWYC